MSRGKGKRKSRPTQVDDDKFYDAVDPSSRDFIYDEVDDYYEKQEREGLKNLNRLMKRQPSNKRNEILAIASSSEDEDLELKPRKKKANKKQFLEDSEPLPPLDSDLEEDQGKADDDEDAITKEWGKKRSMYYNADYVDEEWNDADASDAEVAQREEEEALAIQERLAQQLQDDDFGLEFITQLKEAEKSKETKQKEEEKISLELSSLSKREKLDLLAKESPELLELIEDFKVQLTELKQRLGPVVQLIQDNIIPRTSGSEYVLTKYRLILNYCTQISYYFQLKSKRISVQNHPVIKRLVQFRGLLHQLNLGGDAMEAEIDSILEKLKSKKPIKPEEFEPPQVVSAPPRKKLSILKKLDKKDEKEPIADKKPSVEKTIKKQQKPEELLTRDEQAAIDLYQAISSGKKGKKPAEPVDGSSDSEADEDNNGVSQDNLTMEEETEETGKRAINYQIAKNKGLTPHRSKEQRNPRVKHRNKFRKAKIRRKGQVREARKELKRYDGEISGIKASVVRSVKIK